MSPGMRIHDIAANDERFVAVGRAGLLMTSTDGLNWIDGDAGTYETLLDIKKFSDGFLAYGEAGSIFQSVNGIKWHHRLAGAPYSSLTTGNGIALVPGSPNETTLFRSTNGQHWNQVELPFIPRSMQFVGGYFFSGSFDKFIWQSADGLTWKKFNLPGHEPAPDKFSFPITNGSAFISYIPGFGPGFFQSTDVVNWTFIPIDFSPDIVWAAEDLFYTRTEQNLHYRSTDGATWTEIAASDIPASPYDSVQLGTVTLQNFPRLERSVAGGEFTSILTTIRAHRLNKDDPHAIAQSDGHWLTSAGNYSLDGITWNRASGSGLFVSDNSVDGHRFVSTAHQRFFVLHQDLIQAPTSRLWSSADGINFTKNTDLTERVNPVVTYANGTFMVIATESSSVYRSSDGMNWVKHPDILPLVTYQDGDTVPVHPVPPAIVAHADRFLLYINGKGLFSSTDGLNWAAVVSDLNPSINIRAIKTHDGKLIAHNGSRLWESSDGTTWVTVEDLPLSSINAITISGDTISVLGRDSYTNSLYFAATRNKHGIWTRSIMATNAFPRGITSSDSRTIAVLESNLWATNHDEGPQVIAQAPRDISILQNQSVDTSVSVLSTRPLTYQWARNGQDISGADSLTYHTAGTALTTRSRDALVLKISDGILSTSVTFFITVFPADAPARYNEQGIRADVSKNVHGGLTLGISPSFQGSMLTFQWFKNGAEFTPASDWQEIPINAFTVSDTYQVTATNPAGSATSETITIAWPQLTASEIKFGHPPRGPNPFLSISSAGASGHQWRHNGTPIPGANERSLTLLTNSPFIPADSPSGYYDVLIFNDRQTIRSGPYAYVKTGDSPLPIPVPAYPFSPLYPPYLSNLSVRATTGPGDDALTTGFVLSGDTVNDASLTQSILLRGIGPGLRDYGVDAPLADPVIQLRSATDEILAQNYRWEDFATDLAPQFTLTGAFHLASASLDAALVHPVAATEGSTSFTVPLINNQATESGEALAEVYLVPNGNGSKLSNLSARGSISPTAPLTAGFVIAGTGKLPIFIRAVGPGLDNFDVPGAARAPRLSVFNAAGEKIATSPINYGVIFTDVETASGAFPLPVGSANAAIYIDLPPGSYTAHVEDDEGGIVLLELYLRPTSIVIVELPIDNLTISSLPPQP